MSDTKARRVTPCRRIHPEIGTFESIGDFPNGTHMLVPVEVWEAAMGSKPLSYKYFEEVHRQDDEIERLRPFEAVSVALQKRIEELEKQNDERLKIWNESITIPRDKIRAAWAYVGHAGERTSAEDALEELGIVRCEADGCDNGMMLIAKNTPQCGVQECPDCNGEGFKIGGGDD